MSFTTHKTLCGPRGACIITTDPDDARAIDTAVFPGEQGGPHLHSIAAKAVAFKLAATEQFRRLQQGILDNAKALADGFVKRGLTLAYGGTDTHMCLIDLKCLKGTKAEGLDGEIASRLLDLANIVANKNTIAGDEDAAHPTGVRFGTTWVTQRGLTPADMDDLAGVVHQVLTNIDAFQYADKRGPAGRGKIEWDLLEKSTADVGAIESRASRDEVEVSGPAGYPHGNRDINGAPAAPAGLVVSGMRGGLLLEDAATADILTLAVGQSAATLFLDADAKVIDACVIKRIAANDLGQTQYLVLGTAGRAARLKRWLRALSDGYVMFDRDDILRKVQGPATVNDLRLPRHSTALNSPEIQAALPEADRLDGILPEFSSGETIDGVEILRRHPELVALPKPYFVGWKAVREGFGPGTGERVPFTESASSVPARRSALYDEHLKLTVKSRMVEFGGWIMPIRYTTIAEEHQAVRHTVGLFDVTHMGVLEVSGPWAARFLDLVTTNFISWINPGQSQYGFLLDPDGAVRDDLLVYCIAPERYLVVVNAANAERDLAWLNAVNSGNAVIDLDRPDRRPDEQVVIRDLKDPSSGNDQRVDLALQGPFSRDLLSSILDSDAARHQLELLDWSEVMSTSVVGVPAVISMTGYTGEAVAFEIFVHPEAAPKVWQTLLREGRQFGIRPCALGARDSTRIEAGLPLHGHELAGPYRVSPIECGYAPFVKFHKPFFIGRTAMVANSDSRTMAIARFRLTGAEARMVRQGDAIVSAGGEHVGWVTSATMVERTVIGLAYVRKEDGVEGREIEVYALPHAGGSAPVPTASVPGATDAQAAPWSLGARVLVPRPGVILPRFCRFEGPEAASADASHEFRKKALTERPAGG